MVQIPGKTLFRHFASVCELSPISLWAFWNSLAFFLYSRRTNHAEPMHTCVWMLVAAALLHTLTLHADCKRFDQHGCSPELHERIAHDDRAAHAQLWAQCPCDAATLAISNVDVRIENGHLAVAGAVASTPFRKSYKLPNGAGL